jgi:DNA invertase Pin-like site-specific DNA recombinase
MKPAFGYTRTSSAANVGDDKDSEKRQRAAITAFARSAGYRIAGWYRDPAVSGADPVTDRPGFAAMLEELVADGVCAIIVESPDRFARDLAVQLAGHDYLRGLGLDLVPASAPEHFLEDTPTAVLVRQVLGAISQFEKATLVAKLRAARDRKRKETGRKVEGRPSHAEERPEVVSLARRLRRKRRDGTRASLREVSAKLARAGYVNVNGKPFAPISVSNMVARRPAGGATVTPEQELTRSEVTTMSDEKIYYKSYLDQTIWSLTGADDGQASWQHTTGAVLHVFGQPGGNRWELIVGGKPYSGKGARAMDAKVVQFNLYGAGGRRKP